MDLNRIMWFHCRRLVIGDTMADFILDPHNADVLKARILVVEITNTLTVPEIAFTEDTMADFILDPHNADVLKARIFVVEEQGKHADKELTYHYVCSFLEIYNEQITDLLDPSPKSLQIREDVRTACVYVESLTKELVFTRKDVTQLSVKGLSNRRTGATSANADSSRLHCVFTCVIKSESKVVKVGLAFFL